MGLLFWIFTLLGCAVLTGVWLITLEGEHNRQRKLRKIRRRLEQIETADDARNNEGGGNA